MKHIEAFLYQGRCSSRRRGARSRRSSSQSGTPTYIYSASAIRDRLSAPGGGFLTPGGAISIRCQSPAPISTCVASCTTWGPAWTWSREASSTGPGWLEPQRRAWSSPASARPTKRFARPSMAVFTHWRAFPDCSEREPEKRGPVGILNAESTSELERIAYWGNELGVRPRVCLRVNPDVDPHTHEYTTTGKEENKFGIDAPPDPRDLRCLGPGQEGSTWWGCTSISALRYRKSSPIAEAVEVLLDLVDELERRGQQDRGAGSRRWLADQLCRGVRYQPLEDYAERLIPLLGPRTQNGLQVLMEPGRAIMANSGDPGDPRAARQERAGQDLRDLRRRYAQPDPAGPLPRLPFSSGQSPGPARLQATPRGSRGCQVSKPVMSWDPSARREISWPGDRQLPPMETG